MTTTEQRSAEGLRWASSGGVLHLRIPGDGPVQLVAVEVLHPSGAPVETRWDAAGGRLHVRLPAAPSAMLLRLRRA